MENEAYTPEQLALRAARADAARRARESLEQAIAEAEAGLAEARAALAEFGQAFGQDYDGG